MTPTEKQGAIIFDFDGTIADSFPVALDIFYALTHTPALDDEAMLQLRGMTLIQIAKELRIPLYHVPLLLFRGRQVMRRRMADVHPITGIKQVLRELSTTHKLFILSSNSTRNIRIFLHHNDIENCFEAVYGGVRLLGKAPKIRKLMRQHKLDRAAVCYVGDEVRDIEAAQTAGIKIIAVSWGYNNREALQARHPDRLVTKLDELIHSIKNNYNF